MPLELVPNRDGSLVEHVPVLRYWLSGHNDFDGSEQKPVGKQVLVIADPNNEKALIGASQEGSELLRLFRTFGKEYYCRLLGRSVSSMDIFREIPGTDLLHLAGHYTTRQSGNSIEEGFVLAGDELWLPQQSTQQAPRFVFANCCRAGLISSPGNSLSLVGNLLKSGTKDIIAPYLPIHDHTAKLFALKFYELFLKGESISSAVFHARQIIGPASWSYWHICNSVAISSQSTEISEKEPISLTQSGITLPERTVWNTLISWYLKFCSCCSIGFGIYVILLIIVAIVKLVQYLLK